MTRSSAEYDSKKVSSLAADILKHKRLYYAGRPEISDAAYDLLEEELTRLAPDHPVLALVGVDIDAGSGAGKVEHGTPMLSLQKTYERKDLERWADDQPIVGTLKVDGNSLSVVYRSGRVILAKTRGNGRVGEDVTEKIRWVADVVPMLIGDDNPDIVEIRGELYCTESQFVRLTEKMLTLGLERPTNPRNIVAGSLGRKTHIDLARYFNFFAFDVIGRNFASEFEKFLWLERQGFSLPRPKMLRTSREIDDYLDDVKEVMNADELGIDGAVFTFNDVSRQTRMGNTSHHPRFKMSYKWQGETATVTIEKLAWSTSRLGIITPVAVIEPVFLSGATLTNITLHNAAHVRACNLKAGDSIEIVRSGEVIPKFLQVVNSAEGDYAWPKRCPACGYSLRFDDVRLICDNQDKCPAQQLGAIINWIRAVEIDDLSEKRLLPLMEKGLVKTMADLYRLKLADFYQIPLTKEKMATKLYNNIQNSKTLPLANFLNGLGIPSTGRTSWEKLLESHPTLAAIQNIRVEDLTAIDGFAEKSAHQIVEGLMERRQLIAELLAVGVVPEAPSNANRRSDAPLSGKTIVLTGSLSRPRAEFEKIVKENGGKTSSSVSKNTFAIVTADPELGSSKMRKARQLGVRTWSEDELLQYIETGR